MAEPLDIAACAWDQEGETIFPRALAEGRIYVTAGLSSLCAVLARPAAECPSTIYLPECHVGRGAAGAGAVDALGLVRVATRLLADRPVGGVVVATTAAVLVLREPLPLPEEVN